jgi:hypothetical protein
MLTKTDLDQIRKVIRQEVKVEVSDSTQTLESQIRLSRMEVQASVNKVDDRVKNVEIRLDDIATNVKKLKRAQGTMLDLLDREQMQQRKRIIRLEEQVGIAS